MNGDDESFVCVEKGRRKKPGRIMRILLKGCMLDNVYRVDGEEFNGVLKVEMYLPSTRR